LVGLGNKGIVERGKVGQLKAAAPVFTV